MPLIPAPGIFGIVNLTEDSFSSGGRFLDPGAALAHAERLVADGADVIDLGAATSSPDGLAVTPDEEIRRLDPLVRALHARGVSVSVDSYAPAVQRWGLAQGVAWLNDIGGFAEPALWPELARANARLVVMHSIQRGRADRVAGDPETIVARVLAFFAERVAALEGAGIARERLVLDPGMGFFVGSNPEVSLRLLRALPLLRERTGLPLLVSVSRKSFLGKLTGRDIDDRAAATLAAELYAAHAGVDFIRTHDVRALRDALAVERAVEKSWRSRESPVVNPTPLFRNVDCFGVRVPDIDRALAFYRDKLGHRLLWRTASSAGLAFADAGRMPELVLHTEVWPIETAIKVGSVPEALERFLAAGGVLVEPPSEIAIGRLAVVADPWGNRLVLLDASKGALQTDSEGNVVGVEPET